MRENHGGKIAITFEYGGWGGDPQNGGTVVVSTSVAKWLGKKLIEASTGDLQEEGCVMSVDDEAS